MKSLSVVPVTTKPKGDPYKAVMLIQVGEGERGYLLELLLTKLRYVAVSPDPEAKPDAAHEGLQIIGMSATMPNVASVAQWLGAQLFETDFRYDSRFLFQYQWHMTQCSCELLTLCSSDVWCSAVVRQPRVVTQIFMENTNL